MAAPGNNSSAEKGAETWWIIKTLNQFPFSFYCQIAIEPSIRNPEEHCKNTHRADSCPRC